MSWFVPPISEFDRSPSVSVETCMFRLRIIVITWCLLCSLSGRLASAEETGSLSDFAGAHTRVVWVQDHGTANSDTLATGQRLKLMGLDSEDGRSERAILGDLRNYAKPLLSPDGQHVIFSDQQTQKFFIVNWDGTGRKLLGEGLAVDVWRDPRDGIDWVYAAKRVGKPENVTYRNLRRVKLMEPKVSQKVWDVTDVGCDNFQLAADGIRAAGEFPWPNGGVADLSRKTWKKLNEGCWASIAPDNSGVSWVFDGPHRNLQFHRPDQTEGWKVNVNSAPRIEGAEVFHPRWSNHTRYFAMTGPYNVKGKFNVISGGGPQVEVYLGRFSPDWQSVEAWHQVTDNARGDFYPDVWIDGGEKTVVDLPGLKNPAPSVAMTAWPAVSDELLFAWNNGKQANQLPAANGRPERSCQVALHGLAVPGRFHALRFHGGTGTLQDLDVPLLAAVKSRGELTLEMLVTPGSTKTDAAFCQVGTGSQTQLRLIQDADRLRWELGPARGKTNRPIWSQQKAVQLSVVLTAQALKIFADGKSVLSAAVTPRFADWKSAEVILGGPNWQGDIEAITVYSKSLTPAEIEQQSAATRQRLTPRTPLTTHRLQAACRERSTIPTPQQILPYRRALAVHEFEVTQVAPSPATRTADKSSEMKVGDRILVAQWVILDGQTLPAAAQSQVGKKVELTLEAIADHPELTSERQIQDLEAIDLPLYYDVTIPAEDTAAREP